MGIQFWPREPARAPTVVAFAVWLAALQTGCASAGVVDLRPAAPIHPWALAVYPVVFRFPVSPYEAFVRGRSAAEQLSDRTGLNVFGPGEFEVSDADQDDLVRGTDLIDALDCTSRQKMEGVFAVRLTVSRAVAAQTALAFDQAGRMRAARQEQRTDVTVDVALLSLGQRRVVAEVEGHSRVDPFSTALDQDPYPSVTRLSAKLIERLIDIAGLERSRSAPETGLTTLDTPGPAMAFSFGPRQSLSAELQSLDPLDREGQLLSLFHGVDPDASDARLRLFERAPYGLVVTGAKGTAARAGLAVDDLLLTADGERLTGRYALDRHLRQGQSRLTVQRGSEKREVELRVGG